MEIIHMYENGELRMAWFQVGEIEDVVRAGVKHFQRKYQQIPTYCEISNQVQDPPKSVDGIRIMSVSTLMKNNIMIVRGAE